MDYSEAWNKIVRRTEKIKSKNEEVVQYAWETHFEDMFGYNPEDIESQRPVQMGSTKRTDVVIKNNNNDLFVVEFKRHELSFNDKMQNQLFSYLDREKIDIGILVCDKLYIYSYDFTQKNKFFRLEIPFEHNHSGGMEFLRMFSKENFDKQTIKIFIKDAHQKQLTNPAQPPNPPQPPKPHTYTVDGHTVVGHNGAVRYTVELYITRNKGITFQKLQSDFPDSIAKPFGKMIRDHEIITQNNGQKRTRFINTKLVDGTKIAVSTQWTHQNMKSFIKQARKLGIDIQQ